MRLIRLSVEDFGCIRAADVKFGPGLNVLYGPNDLGKSSLAEAIRAVLLMQHSSSGHEPYVQWRTDKSPSVELVFQTEPQRYWRLRKTFGAGAKGSSTLEFSKDGVSFSTDAKGRHVDGELRKLLKWGIPEPGGRGGRRGLHESFLTTVLLAQQQDVTSVFRSDLSGDEDTSGKDRLTEALQAIAQDPLFTKVLTATQSKVDEAFTNTGKKKRGHTSPFTEIADEVRKAAETELSLEASLTQSETARERITYLMDERLRREARVGEATALLAKLQLATVKRGEADTARQEFERIAGLKKRLSEAEQEKAGMQRDLAELEKARDAADTKFREAHSAYQAAEHDLGELKSASSEQKRKLEIAELEKNRLILVVRQRELSDQEASLARIQKLVDDAADLEQELKLHTHSLQKHREELAASKRAVEDGSTYLHLLKAVGAWLELKEVQSQLHHLAATARRGAESRGIAQEKRREADQLQAEIAGRLIPTDDEISGLEELQNQIRSAEASTSVGLTVVVTPQRAFDALVAQDRAKPEKKTLDAPAIFDADREIVLEIEGLGTIDITGGTVHSRHQLNALRERWNTNALPALAAAKASTLDDLRRTSRERHLRELTVQRLEQEASALEAQSAEASTPDREARAMALQDQAAAAENALTSFDRRVLEEQCTAMGSSTRAELRGLVEKTTSDADHAKRAMAELDVQIARDETKHHAMTEERDEAISQRDHVLERFGADWMTTLKKTRAELSRVGEDDVTVREKMRTLKEGPTEQLQAAVQRVAAAQSQREKADQKRGLIEKDIVDSKTVLGQCQGRLEERRRAVEHEDEAGVRLTVSRIEKEVSALESELSTMGHMGTVDEHAVQAASDSVRWEQSELRQIEEQLSQAKGALSHVGGDVARERLEGARERHKRLRVRECELDTEFGAWKLLRDTLHEAEQDQATHLGEGVITPITQRFQELAGERYGQLELGPNLETEGIEASGGQRTIESLSVGTQEQLATIFRLSLAERLKSVLVLDDQLAQSDEVRMKWFKQKLKESAENIQIVVFTCRPEDYLDNALPSSASDASKDTYAVDLAKVLDRTS